MTSSNTELFFWYSDIKKEAQKKLYADFVVCRYCILHSSVASRIFINNCQNSEQSYGN